MAVGQSAEVTVRVVNGGWDSLDVAGGYWASDEPVDLADGEYEATATLVATETILVQLDAGRTVSFSGPVGCE